MKIVHRQLESQIIKDLAKKMVLVAGPRQVGKTSLGKSLLGQDLAGYRNWDVASQRERILKQQHPDTVLWVFDELHKYKSWRAYLKGVYDQFHPDHQILVTGSARLDYYRYGGDSLQGRYYHLRLGPLTVGELGLQSQSELQDLLTLGGFPEPYFSASQVEARRWSREYRTRLIEEELLSLERVHDVGQLELLMLRLPDCMGSPLSINSLREDLQVSHKTLSRWLDIFERIYAIIRIPPFGSPILRAVKKEQKHYHFDWTLAPNKGVRFENLVAIHLLKWVQYQQDTQGRDVALRYFRDVDRREVDFILIENNKPISAIECKWSDDDISSSLKYFKQRFVDCNAWQISFDGKQDFISGEGIRVCPAWKYLLSLAC